MYADRLKKQLAAELPGKVVYFKDWKKKEKVPVRACLCVCGGVW